MKVFTRRCSLPALLFLGSLGLYVVTAIRTPGWLDDTLILSFARSASVSSWVSNHNLFNLLGWCWISLFSFLDPHAALTLLCGLFASTAVLFAYHAGRELTGNPMASALAAAALAVSHSLWWHATVVEVYSLNAALICLILFLVLRFFRSRSFPCLLAAFFLFGIGVFNHLLMGLFAPAYAALFVMVLTGDRRIGRRRGLLLVAAAALGCIPTLVVLARAVAMDVPALGVGGALSVILDGATGSFFRKSMFPANLAPGQKLFWRLNYVFLLWYNYPAAALPLAAWGTVRLRLPETPRPFAVFFLLAIVAQVIWSSNYLIWDMYAFAMPVYVLASVPLAAGVDALLRSARPVLRTGALASLLLPPVLYLAVTELPLLAAPARWYISMFRESSWVGAVFDPLGYVMSPIKSGYQGVDQYCLGVLQKLPPGAHFWDDEAKAANPLKYYYLPVRKLRPDVTLHAMFPHTVDPGEEAAVMRGLLAAGSKVFVSDLSFPERDILIALAATGDHSVNPASLNGLTEDELLSRLPGVEVERVPLGTRAGLSIWRVRYKASVGDGP
jgi:hypothetical protein